MNEGVGGLGIGDGTKGDGIFVLSTVDVVVGFGTGGVGTAIGVFFGKGSVLIGILCKYPYPIPHPRLKFQKN